MIEIPAPPAWTADAACLGTDTDSFFPEGQSAGLDALYAKRICTTCPLNAIIGCARSALELNTRHKLTGVWAGEYLGYATRSRTESLKALHAIAGIPYQPETRRSTVEWPRPCTRCARSMRPRNAAEDEYSATVRYGAKDMCDTCANAKRKGEDAGTFIKAAS